MTFVRRGKGSGGVGCVGGFCTMHGHYVFSESVCLLRGLCLLRLETFSFLVRCGDRRLFPRRSVLP